MRLGPVQVGNLENTKVIAYTNTVVILIKVRGNVEREYFASTESVVSEPFIFEKCTNSIRTQDINIMKQHDSIGKRNARALAQRRIQRTAKNASHFRNSPFRR